MMTKTVIVTGAAGGMGLEALRILAQRDVNVVCVDLDQASVSQAIDLIGPTTGRLLAIGAAVSDDSAVRNHVARALAAFGVLHVVYNIAWTAGNVLTFPTTTVQDLERDLGENVNMAFTQTKQ